MTGPKRPRVLPKRQRRSSRGDAASVTVGSGAAVQAAIPTDEGPVSMDLEIASGVVTMFVEYFALDLTMEDEERCLRCTAMCVEDGFTHRFRAHSTILATDVS